MRQIVINLSTPVCLMATMLQVGCQPQQQPTTRHPSDSASVSASEEPRSTDRDKRFAVAVEAKDALFASLSGRLMEVMKSEGPVAAINVCSQEAVRIADTVAAEQGVEIGRTSFKLRNPNNAPRDWVKPFVKDRTDTPQQVELENGKLGALFPIRLDVKCLMCHGTPEDILGDVKPELARLYPDDQATGFQQGDLRGWFWVEVPSDVQTPDGETTP